MMSDQCLSRARVKVSVRVTNPKPSLTVYVRGCLCVLRDACKR